MTDDIEGRLHAHRHLLSVLVPIFDEIKPGALARITDAIGKIDKLDSAVARAFSAELSIIARTDARGPDWLN